LTVRPGNWRHVAWRVFGPARPQHIYEWVNVMDLGLQGRCALVTGASQGIGEGVARTLAAEGVHLHLTARNAANLERVKAEIGEIADVTVQVHPMDITAPGACETLARLAGDADILVNNAGNVPGGDLYQVDEAKWRAGWDLKVFGYINMCRSIYPGLKARGGGVIVNIIGNAGEVPDPGYIAGCTGNASLMAFTRALGGNSLADNVRVVAINPGPVRTERIYDLLRQRAKSLYGDETRYTELEATYPLKRPAHISEIADLVAFLASDRSGYTSGVIFTVDGGISSRRSII
jgi:NAD(P)-dependent dehydrogenase (short-subunit alcohol dehydrogenase family)